MYVHMILLYRCNCYCFSSFILRSTSSSLFVYRFLSLFFSSFFLRRALSVSYSLFIYLPYAVTFMDTKTNTDTRLSYFIIIKVLRLYGFFFIIIIITIHHHQPDSCVSFVHYNIALWTFQCDHCNQCVLHCTYICI